MTYSERLDIRPDVLNQAVEDYRRKPDMSVENLNLSEFDEWLKETVIKYRYPLVVSAFISVGWLTYRAVDQFFKRTN